MGVALTTRSKLVAHQAAVGQALDRVAGAGHAHGGRDLVQQADSDHLVRHGDERAADVGEREDAAQEGRVVLGLAAEGHDHRVDPVLLEEGVVDHR